MHRSPLLNRNLIFPTLLVLASTWALLQAGSAQARSETIAWEANREQLPPQARLSQATSEGEAPGSVATNATDSGLALWGPLVLVSLAGMFGGLLYGIKEHRLELPYRKGRHTIHPGFLTDILFGVGGGLIIYMIMPGSFNYEAGGFELIKILAVSMVGGYGGRALVERVLASQLKDLESQVQQIQEEQSADAMLVKLINRHLDDDPDTPPVDMDEIKKTILAASDTGREDVFEKARNYRKKVTKEGEWKLLDNVVPVFEGLVDSDPEEEEARFHAQLGFALKDRQLSSESPQLDMYRRAKKELDKAIEIRDRLKNEEKWVYEFARAMTNIELNADPKEIRDDLEKACNDKDIAVRVKSPGGTLGKPLIDWLRARQTELKDWIETMRIILPEEDEE